MSLGKHDSLRGADALARAVEREYAAGGTDYSLAPLNLEDEAGNPLGTVKPNDAVIFCCRRGEREIELTDAFTDPAFTGFEREKIDPLDFVILTMYSEKYTYLPIAFAPAKVEQTLAQTVADAGKTQLHLAESEKYAHVTFFFNGGNNAPFQGEEDVRIPSPKGVPFDEVPELSLEKVADRLIEGIGQGYDFIVANFANGDVIGHTSNDAAKVRCAAVVDFHLGRVLEKARSAGYAALVTADHGNLEIMRTAEGKPHVAHTDNLVACAVVAEGAKAVKETGRLADVAPTVLAAMGLEKPTGMAGEKLFAFPGAPKKTLLIILDGWGIGEKNENNPIFLADTPAWDALLRENPHILIAASGEAVGLGPGKAGNSEAGHINLGAGRLVLQDDVRLDAAMKDGSFSKNPVFLSALEGVKARGGALHLIALLTEKSSHGSVDYPLALLDMAQENGFENVIIHVIFDGRSTEPGSAPALLRAFGRQMEDRGVGFLVSGVGRGIALDRDGNWPKVKRAYDSLVAGVGARYRE